MFALGHLSSPFSVLHLLSLEQELPIKQCVFRGFFNSKVARIAGVGLSNSLGI